MIEELRSESMKTTSGRDVQTLDMVDMLCTETTRRLIDDGVPFYRGYKHLSKAWTLTQVPRLTRILEGAVSAAAGD